MHARVEVGGILCGIMSQCGMRRGQSGALGEGVGALGSPLLGSRRCAQRLMQLQLRYRGDNFLTLTKAIQLQYNELDTVLMRGGSSHGRERRG
jgi:hypothetical protein|eukprot:6845428-Prymnesium_polylepis.2